MAADFRQLLEAPMDEIKRPPAWPAGTYHGTVKSHEYGESRNKKTPFVKYHFAVTSAGEDVSLESLEGIDLAKRDLTKDYYLTPDSMYRVKEFLESLGVNTEGRSLGACIPEAANARVIIAITQRNSEDGKDVFNDVGDVRGEE